MCLSLFLRRPFAHPCSDSGLVRSLDFALPSLIDQIYHFTILNPGYYHNSWNILVDRITTLKTPLVPTRHRTWEDDGGEVGKHVVKVIHRFLLRQSFVSHMYRDRYESQFLFPDMLFPRDIKV